MGKGGERFGTEGNRPPVPYWGSMVLGAGGGVYGVETRSGARPAVVAGIVETDDSDAVVVITFVAVDPFAE